MKVSVIIDSLCNLVAGHSVIEDATEDPDRMNNGMLYLLAIINRLSIPKT